MAAINSLHDFRARVRELIEAGDTPEAAARAALKEANPHALLIEYARNIGPATHIGGGGRWNAPARMPVAAAPAPVRSTRWQIVAAMSNYPRAWPVLTPDGRQILLGHLTADELRELAEQYECDAEEAHALAKKLRRLADALDAHPRAHCADALPSEVVEEAFE